MKKFFAVIVFTGLCAALATGLFGVVAFSLIADGSQLAVRCIDVTAKTCDALGESILTKLGKAHWYRAIIDTIHHAKQAIE
jgi:hypothetical protein